MRLSATLSLFVVCLIPLLTPMTVRAADAGRYRVDAIVFLDNGGVGDEQPLTAAPSIATGIPYDDAGRLSAAGITRLSDASFGLDNEWRHLRNARRFRPLLRLVWVQTAAASGTPVAIDTAAGTADAHIAGTLALYVGTFLHVDAHLVYTFSGESGTAKSYRLDEVRRVKFDELHYLDSPRVGVIARVTKLQ